MGEEATLTSKTCISLVSNLTHCCSPPVLSNPSFSILASIYARLLVRQEAQIGGFSFLLPVPGHAVSHQVMSLLGPECRAAGLASLLWYRDKGHISLHITVSIALALCLPWSRYLIIFFKKMLLKKHQSLFSSMSYGI